MKIDIEIYDAQKHFANMNITVNRIYFKPVVTAEKVDILGQTFRKIVTPPNLYVVDTDDDIIEEGTVEFKYDSVFYTLKGVTVIKSDGKTFIECREWIEELF